ncbi:MAG: hypothetical protein JO170_31330 [Verrucomicrobia bacterium]|nr:hypothetical protein [Verrucomicrobiota bacterium]
METASLASCIRPSSFVREDELAERQWRQRDERLDLFENFVGVREDELAERQWRLIHPEIDRLTLVSVREDELAERQSRRLSQPPDIFVIQFRPRGRTSRKAMETLDGYLVSFVYYSFMVCPRA